MRQEAEAEEADLAFEGGEIVTLDRSRRTVQAIAVRDGRILALGNRKDVQRHVGPSTRRVDLEGRTLVPGFVDHHVHLVNIGFSLLNDKHGGEMFLDLADARSEHEVAQRVAERARKQVPGTWILGKNWSQNGWGIPAMPTHHVLTSAAPDNPVLLSRIDMHSAWVNARALEMAGIRMCAKPPDGGGIVKLEDGTPSGILIDRAVEPVLELAPDPSDEQIREAFRLAIDGLSGRGFTRVYDAGFLEFPSLLSLDMDQERYLRLLLEEDATDPFPVDIHLMIMAPSALAEKVCAEPGRWRELSPRIRITNLKLHADGAFGSRGATLTHHYHDDPKAEGVCRSTPEKLEHWVRRGVDAGLDIAVHAIGDRANGMTLDVYEKALRDAPDVKPRRLRVEHFSYASYEDMHRATNLGVLLVVQPNFVEPDEHGNIMEELRLGHINAARAYAFGDLTAIGAWLAGSTDDYTFTPDAIRNFWAAATRRSPIPGSMAAWQPSQRLSRWASLELLTRWFDGGGGPPLPASLHEGARADMVVLSGNPLEIPEDEILGLKIHATWRAGEGTFDDGSISAPQRKRPRRRRPRPRLVPTRPM